MFAVVGRRGSTYIAGPCRITMPANWYRLASANILLNFVRSRMISGQDDFLIGAFFFLALGLVAPLTRMAFQVAAPMRIMSL